MLWEVPIDQVGGVHGRPAFERSNAPRIHRRRVDDRVDRHPGSAIEGSLILFVSQAERKPV